MQTFPSAHRNEFGIFKKLNFPAKNQDFLDALPINFEEQGDTWVDFFQFFNIIKASYRHA